MPATYDANLREDQLEWSAAPLSGHRDIGRGAADKVALALDRIAARGGIESIPDPVAWQREIRTDRDLPGR